jgi:chromosome segregation ATPase
MTASSEARAMIALLPDAKKFAARLEELIAATEQANAAVANLKLQEQATSSKLEVQETLLASLQAQTDELAAANAAAAASRVAAENDLARRLGELETAKAAHADEVKRSLDMFKEREAELKQRQSVLDADFHRRLEDLRAVEDKIRSHHVGLRAVIDETRRGIAAAS